MAKFEVYTGNDNKHHWRLKASNGEKVAYGEAYETRQGALNGAQWVKRWAGGAEIVEIN